VFQVDVHRLLVGAADEVQALVNRVLHVPLLAALYDQARLGAGGQSAGGRGRCGGGRSRRGRDGHDRWGRRGRGRRRGGRGRRRHAGQVRLAQVAEQGPVLVVGVAERTLDRHWDTTSIVRVNQ